MAAVSVGHDDYLGTETGRLATRVLHGDKNIPTVVARGSEVYLNRKAAALVGVTIPQDTLQRTTKVFDDIKFRLNKFLSGIIVVAITYSLSLRVVGASSIRVLQSASIFDLVKPLDGACGAALHAGTILLLSALLAGGVSLLIVGPLSRRGMRLRIAGSNPEYARSPGTSVPRNLVFGLALTNALAAVSGVLLSMHQGFADIGMEQGKTLIQVTRDEGRAFSLGDRTVALKGGRVVYDEAGAPRSKAGRRQLRSSEPVGVKINA